MDVSEDVLKYAMADCNSNCYIIGAFDFQDTRSKEVVQKKKKEKSVKESAESSY